MNVWIENCCVDGSIVLAQNCANQLIRQRNSNQSFNLLTVFKVELVEIHSLHQVAHRFWLESSQVWITDLTESAQHSTKFTPKSPTNSRVSVEVAAVDGLDELFRHLDDLLASQSDSVVFVDVVGRR
jgi:hypothetical protein